MLCGSGGSKSRLAKAAGAEPSGQMSAVVARQKRYKSTPPPEVFGRRDLEKAHAAVARSTFGSKNAKNTSVSDHFWKLRCLKSARSCSAHRISKSKHAKHISSWQGEMSENVHAVVARSTFRSQNGQSTTCLDFCGRHNGFCTLPKGSKT